MTAIRQSAEGALRICKCSGSLRLKAISPLNVKFVPACALHADRQKRLRPSTGSGTRPAYPEPVEG